MKNQRGFSTVLTIIITAVLTAALVVGGLALYTKYTAEVKPEAIEAEVTTQAVTTPVVTTPATTTTATPAVTTPQALETYKSAVFGYSIQYKPEYRLLSVKNNALGKIRESVDMIKGSDADNWVRMASEGEGPENISFNVYENPKNLSTIEWAENNTNITNFGGPNDKNGISTPQYTTVDLAGTKALTYTVEGMGTYTYYILQIDKYILVLTANSYGIDNYQIVKDFKEMIPTLKI